MVRWTLPYRPLRHFVWLILCCAAAAWGFQLLFSPCFCTLCDLFPFTVSFCCFCHFPWLSDIHCLCLGLMVCDSIHFGGYSFGSVSYSFPGLLPGSSHLSLSWLGFLVDRVMFAVFACAILARFPPGHTHIAFCSAPCDLTFCCFWASLAMFLSTWLVPVVVTLWHGDVHCLCFGFASVISVRICLLCICPVSFYLALSR